LKLSSIIQLTDIVVFKFQSAGVFSHEQFSALKEAFKSKVTFQGTTVPSFIFKVRNLEGHKLLFKIEGVLKEMVEFLQLPSNE